MKIKQKIQLKALCQKGADGKLRIIASDETIDRSGESIPFESWDLTNFLRSPRLLIDHDYSVKSIVGKAENVQLDADLRALTFEPVFHDITLVARETKEMVEQGFLDTVSVGFSRSGPEEENIKNELMEVSFVAVPANPNAHVLSVKDISADEVKAVEEFIGEKMPAEAAKAEVGDFCTLEDGAEGEMVLDEDGELICMGKKKEDEPEKKPEEVPAVEEEKKVEIKSGRVLSQKNRDIITTAKDAMASSIAALDELLKATEPGGSSEDGEEEKELPNPKGRKPCPSKQDDSYEKFVELRKVAKAITTIMSEALANAKLKNLKQ